MCIILKLSIVQKSDFLKRINKATSELLNICKATKHTEVSFRYCFTRHTKAGAMRSEMKHEWQCKQKVKNQFLQDKT